jgi:hypothetical protein
MLCDLVGYRHRLPAIKEVGRICNEIWGSISDEILFAGPSRGPNLDVLETLILTIER